MLMHPLPKAEMPIMEQNYETYKLPCIKNCLTLKSAKRPSPRSHFKLQNGVIPPRSCHPLI
eukprot:scaffold10532_cov449-Chaetoceros_neogracile.AAC.18